jgi:HEAT repeat protein
MNLTELIEQLNSPTVQDRIAAADALGRLGAGAKAADFPLLIRYAETDDPAERDAVARALSQIDPESLRLARCARTLEQDRKSARAWAQTVGASQAVAKAREMLWAWDGDTRAFEREGPVREAAALLVENPPGLLSAFLDRSIGKMPPGALAAVLYLAGQEQSNALRALEALRGHPDVEVAAAAGSMCRRIEAEGALTDEGRQLVALAVEHPTVIPELIDGLVNRPRLRRRLKLVLQFVVSERPEATDQLVPLLRSGDVEVVQLVADAVYGAEVDGPRARAMAEALLDLYDRPDRNQLKGGLPEWPLVALEQGPGGREVVEAVLGRVRAAPAWAVSYLLYHLLADMAHEAPAGPGREALLRLMEGEEGALIRAGALPAGGLLDDERITQACCGALRDADPEVRSAAAAAMTSWTPGRLAGVQQELLLPGLGDRCLEVAEHLAYCLGKLGPAAKDALPALRARLRQARALLKGLLGDVGPGRQAATKDHVRRAKKSVRRFREAIKKVGPPSAP